MPHLGRRVFAPEPPPPDLVEGEEVWVCHATGEVFRNYDKYVNRAMLLRQRVWTCEVTGSSHLTYQAALAREERMRKESAALFPEPFVRPLCEMVHLSTVTLRELVDAVSELFRNTLFPGEEIEADLSSISGSGSSSEESESEDGRTTDTTDTENSRAFRCVVVGPSTGALTEDGYPRFYDVRWVCDVHPDVTRIHRSNLIRDERPPTKTEIKRYIRVVSTRDDASQRWIVREDLCRRYGLESAAHVPGVAGAKRRRTPTTSFDPSSGTGASSSKKRKSGGGSSAAAAAGDAASAAAERSKPKAPRWPIEDTSVPPDGKPRPARPVGSTEFIVPPEQVGNVLMLWDFCFCFAEVLELEPFSFDDFEQALVYIEQCPMITELLLSLMRMLTSEIETKDPLRRDPPSKLNLWQLIPAFLQSVWIDEALVPPAELIRKLVGDHGMDDSDEDDDDDDDGDGDDDDDDDDGDSKNNSSSNNADEDSAEREARRARKQRKQQEREERKEKKRQEKLEAQAASLGAAGTAAGASGPPSDPWMTLTLDERVRLLVSLVHAYLDVVTVRDILDGSMEQLESLRRDLRESEVDQRRDINSKLEDLRAKRRKDSAMAGASNGAAAATGGSNSGKTSPAPGAGETTRTQMKKAAQEAMERERDQALEQELNEAKSRLKSDVEKQMQDAQDKYVLKTLPLGSDRQHNMYWFFSGDVGRLFIHAPKHDKWSYLETREQLEQLRESLDDRGIRERALLGELDRWQSKIIAGFRKRANIIADPEDARRSTRIRSWGDGPAFLRYTNTWKRRDR